MSYIVCMIFDLHNDLLTSKLSEHDMRVRLKGYLDKDNAIVLAVWSDEEVYSAQYLRQIIAKYCGNSVHIALENCWYINEESLDEYASLPILYASLTWNNDNRLGGGAFGNGGLTEYGKRVVKGLEHNGIIIDTAHLNRKTFFDILRISSGPIINSHSLMYDVYPHRRNIADDQIREIIDSNGIVGLTLVKSFVGSEAFSYRLIRHIDWFVQKFGINYLAIGTDYHGTTEIPKSVASYELLEEYIKRGLTRLGYKEGDINRILFGNANRLVKKYGKPTQRESNEDDYWR